MFNKTDIKLNPTATVRNQPSGIIQRSNEKSYFRRMHSNSRLAESIFSIKPHYKYGYNDEKEKEVEVLQVMLLADGWLLVEILEKQN